MGSPKELKKHIFSRGQWRRARLREHPIVTLHLSLDQIDYDAFGAVAPNLPNVNVDAMADSEVESSLWSLRECLKAGIRRDQLLPVTAETKAANKPGISICGAVHVLMTCRSNEDTQVETREMTYISQYVVGFYFSFKSMVKLGIIPGDFAATRRNTQEANRAAVHVIEISREANAGCMSSEASHHCWCSRRTELLKRTRSLPLQCTPSNSAEMREWPTKEFAGSTFNTCHHRPLPSMKGPSVEIHLSERAVPRAVHTAAVVPVHWQQKVQADLIRDKALGVIEKVPYGEPVTWCQRMVLTRKQDGTPWRTVDLSSLNKICQRQSFATESPFNLTRQIPPNN